MYSISKAKEKIASVGVLLVTCPLKTRHLKRNERAENYVMGRFSHRMIRSDQSRSSTVAHNDIRLQPSLD
jgi:hypothetical protein